MSRASADPGATTVPGPAGPAPFPLAVRTPLAERVILSTDEVAELCDLLWRAERALAARGWRRLGAAAGAWVGHLEERLLPAQAP